MDLYDLYILGILTLNLLVFHVTGYNSRLLVQLSCCEVNGSTLLVSLQQCSNIPPAHNPQHNNLRCHCLCQDSQLYPAKYCVKQYRVQCSETHRERNPEYHQHT